VIDADHGFGWPNREVMVRARGPVVGELQAVFVADWFLETQQELVDHHLYPPAEDAGTSLGQVLPSGPDIKQEVSMSYLLPSYTQRGIAS
jgi:cardiolipin synthase